MRDDLSNLALLHAQSQNSHKSYFVLALPVQWCCTTIVLSAPLEITHDTAIVGRLDGAAPPTLLSRNEHSVIRSERGKALRLEGLALQVVSSDGGAGDAVFCSEDSDARSWPSRNRGGAGDGGAGAAVYALGGQLEMRDCSVTSACGDGCHLVGSCRAGFEGLHITDCRDYGIYVGGRGANLLAARVTVERFGREAVRGEGGAEVVLGDPGHNFVVAAPELRAGWYNSSDSSDSSDSDDSDDISSELGQPLPVDAQRRGRVAIAPPSVRPPVSDAGSASRPWSHDGCCHPNDSAA
jgi:hypothetical protein